MGQETQSKLEVMNLTLVCQSFPRLREPLVPRDNILDTIERMFDGEIELVAIEGDEGMGKTTLLAQFAQRHPNHTFSVFLRPASRLGYDPTSVRYDLCCQLLWALHPDEVCKPEESDEGYLRNRLLELRRRARRETYYFVLDGLADIPDEGTRNIILDVFPLGEGFRFLISGDLNLLPNHVRKRVECKSSQMVSFSLDETVKYLADLGLERDLVEELYQACGRGIPGHLSSVRRNIYTGQDPRTLIKDKIIDLFEKEWDPVRDDEMALQTLAVIVHAQHRPTIEEVARFLRQEKEQVRTTIQGLTFLAIDDRTSEVTFEPESFCKFATDKLRNRRERVIDLIINDLMARRESEVAINYLPTYLEYKGKLDEVLQCLSPEYFVSMVEHSQSLVPVRQKADVGISAAMKLGRHGELIRFSMQKSAIAELEGAEVWRSEIEALMALNDYTAAMNLVQSMFLKEDRLHLLAVIAKFRREQGQPAETELLQQIRTLYNQLEPISLEDRAIDIASDLFYSCPDLAIDLVERATWTEAGENALDLAYTRLSIAALGAPNLPSEPRDKIEVIRDRIKDPKLRSFTAAASLAVGNQTAQEVIAAAKKMDRTTEDRLHLLRQWVIENRERLDAADTVEYALDLAVKTAAYAPNARVLRELAAPLPFVKDEQRARLLVGVFDSQKNTVEDIGPTEDFVRLQLLLARAEKKYDTEACRNRIVEVYLYIHEIDDLAVKSSCFAWLLAALNRIDPNGELEAKDQTCYLATEDLKSSIDNLLQETAHHYHLTRSIIEALVTSNPDMSLELAMSLNTEGRRDAALIGLVDSMLETKPERTNFDILDRVLASFADQNLRDEAVSKIIERFSGERECPKTVFQKLLPLIDRISEIRSTRMRCRAYCLAHSFLSRSDPPSEYDSMCSHLLSLLQEAWESIDVDWTKVDVGFQIVRSLAEHAPGLAREYLAQTESARNESTFSANTAARTYRTCLRLAVRTFAGLLPRHVDTESDYLRLRDLIDHLPSSGARARIWAELALRCFAAKRSDEGRRIVAEHVRPLLYRISDSDRSYRADIVVSVAPALYMTHPLTAKEFIRDLPQPDRDHAFAGIAEFILRKRPLSDPYERHDQGYDVYYDAILDILEIIHEIDEDALVYHLIQCISETVSSNRFKDRFSQQQRANVVGRLEIIVSAKFPDLKNIRHDGYKIAAESQIAQIQRAKPQVWDDIIAKARAIPNISDRAYVLAIAGAAMLNRDSGKRRAAFEEAISVAACIRSDFDRISRFVDLASAMMDSESGLAKSCLRSAMESLIKRDASGLRFIQRRIVDLAFKLDPDLAASLASLADDDPARGYARTVLKQRLETLKLKKRIMDDLPSGQSIPIQYKAELPRAAWMALGSLNAGRARHKQFEFTRESIRLAANYPLRQAYPILAWGIENAVQRLSNTDQANTSLRQVLEATFLATEISARVATRFSEQIQRVKRRGERESDDGTLLVRAGDRARAFQFLHDWCASEVKGYLKICDQFFGPDDLEVLILLQSANPKCKVHILTSKKHHDQEGIPSPDVEYWQSWRRISDQDPPETEIVIVGIESSGKSPIHDRWWLTEGAGLWIGTSFNSLGKTQDSIIKRISEADAEQQACNVDQYLLDRKREYNGERLRYLSITL